MHGRHLTQNKSSWVFQLRIPQRFKCLQLPAAIRLTLGPVSKRVAQDAARALAASAYRAFYDAQEKLNDMPDDLNEIDSEAIRHAIYARMYNDVAFLIPLHDGVEHNAPDAAARLQRRIRDVEAGLKGADMAQAFSLSAVAPAVNSRLDTLTEAVKRLELASENHKSGIRPNAHGAKRKMTMRFSAAADSYYQLLKDAHGEKYDELKYIAHRKVVFIQICGDKPVDDYTSDDLQHFLNRIRHLPPNYSKLRGFNISQVNIIIDQSIKAGTIGLDKTPWNSSNFE